MSWQTAQLRFVGGSFEAITASCTGGATSGNGGASATSIQNPSRSTCGGVRMAILLRTRCGPRRRRSRPNRSRSTARLEVRPSRLLGVAHRTRARPGPTDYLRMAGLPTDRARFAALYGRGDDLRATLRPVRAGRHRRRGRSRHADLVTTSIDAGWLNGEAGLRRVGGSQKRRSDAPPASTSSASRPLDKRDQMLCARLIDEIAGLKANDSASRRALGRLRPKLALHDLMPHARRKASRLACRKLPQIAKERPIGRWRSIGHGSRTAKPLNHDRDRPKEHLR